jgi:hypothetical protein
MKKLQKFKAIVVNGVVKKEEEVLEKPSREKDAAPVVRNLMDSIAAKLEVKQNHELAFAKENKSNLDVIIWKEPAKAKTQKSK